MREPMSYVMKKILREEAFYLMKKLFLFSAKCFFSEGFSLKRKFFILLVESINLQSFLCEMA